MNSLKASEERLCRINIRSCWKLLRDRAVFIQTRQFPCLELLSRSTLQGQPAPGSAPLVLLCRGSGAPPCSVRAWRPGLLCCTHRQPLGVLGTRRSSACLETPRSQHSPRCTCMGHRGHTEAQAVQTGLWISLGCDTRFCCSFLGHKLQPQATCGLSPNPALSTCECRAPGQNDGAVL